MLRVEIHLTGLTEQQQRLAKLSASFKNFSSALTALGKQMVMFYSQTVFISQGSALGKQWTALKPASQAYKSKHWPGRGPLVRTGAMQEAFYDEVTPNTLFISNRASYFPYQQLGTSPGTGRGHNIPAREMIGVNDTVEAMIKTALETDIRAKIAGTSL